MQWKAKIKKYEAVQSKWFNLDVVVEAETHALAIQECWKQYSANSPSFTVTEVEPVEAVEVEEPPQPEVPKEEEDVLHTEEAPTGEDKKDDLSGL
jgi:hypothetical protein